MMENETSSLLESSKDQLFTNWLITLMLLLNNVNSISGTKLNKTIPINDTKWNNKHNRLNES